MEVNGLNGVSGGEQGRELRKSRQPTTEPPRDTAQAWTLTLILHPGSSEPLEAWTSPGSLA